MPEIDFDAETAPDAWDALREAEPELAGHLKIRVKLGAALLDEVRPDWFRALRLDTLRMESDDTDVAGQLFGAVGKSLGVLGEPLGVDNFGAALSLPVVFGIIPAGDERSWCDAPDCLDCTRTKAKVDARYDALTALWVRAAKGRLAAGQGEVAGA